jgi:hypothetical protein
MHIVFFWKVNAHKRGSHKLPNSECLVSVYLLSCLASHRYVSTEVTDAVPQATGFRLFLYVALLLSGIQQDIALPNKLKQQSIKRKMNCALTLGSRKYNNLW